MDGSSAGGSRQREAESRSKIKRLPRQPADWCDNLGTGRDLRLCVRTWWRFPRRGGNYNNGSNAGLGYVNSNNARGNGNWNYGVRLRSRLIYSAARSRISGLLIAALFPPL